MDQLVKTRRHTWRRAVGTAVAATLTGATLAVVPTTAHAAEPTAPTLSWKISDQFAGHLGTHTLSGGATEDSSGVVTFGNGVGTHDAGNGITTVSYEGSVTGGFENAGEILYSVTFADPAIEIDESGEGRITADVSSVQNTAQGPTSPAGTTPPTRVTVTTFDATADDWTASGGLTSLTDTPDWSGVLPAGSQPAIDLGITNPDRPVDGKSFAPEFLGAIMPGTRAHFHFTTGSDAKAPAEFTAQAPVPTVKYQRTSTSNVAVQGSGFTCVTNSGDAGIYVGLAPAGAMPDVSSPGGASAFAAVTPQFCFPPTPAISGPDGAWSTNLAIDMTKIKPGFAYSIFTWRAHTHSTTSQDTQTRVGVIKKAKVLKGKMVLNKRPTSKAKGKATVRIPGVKGVVKPNGKATFKFTKGKVNRYTTVKLYSGKRKINLPKLAKGTWTVRVRYQGDVRYQKKGYTKVRTFKVFK